MNLNLCPDAVPSLLNFFDVTIAPPLLFYAYIPIFILSIFFGWFIFKKSTNSTLNKYFLGITLSFSAWIFLILFQWVAAYLEVVQLAWQLLILPEVAIFSFSVLFTYSFIFKRDVPLWCKYILGGIFIFLSIILSTNLNIQSFDLTNCQGVVGKVWPFVYVFELVNIVVIVLIAIERLFSKNDRADKTKNFLMSIGVIFFLGIFWLSNYFGELTQTYEINLIGPIGMIMFLGLLSYLIVKFQTFNIKLIATQALVWVLAILIGSQLFFIKTQINMILTGITFLASVILGYFLIQSVKKEVQQREELAKLNLQLNDLIKQRENLVHLVTHKVKGSFTRSKYIFAGLLDGTFGQISDEVKKRAEQGLESDNMGIETVDLVLSVANMQKGVVKYDMKEMDLKEVTLKTVSEKTISAEMRGLKILTDIKDDTYKVNGDTFWIKEIINNFVENSIKYTKEGTITVGLKKENGKVVLSVKDTGFGITEEDKKNLFTEGGRGKDSVKVNVDSTGYGLYSVKLIAEAHNGRVWAESEGQGKGSTFFLELGAI